MSGDTDPKSWTHIHGWVVVVLLPHLAKDFVACEASEIFLAPISGATPKIGKKDGPKNR